MAVKGRPKSEAKRQQILRTAQTLFLTHGFDGVSMDAVAEQANVSKQTVYSHFRSKDELYSATIAQKCEANMVSAEFMDESKAVDIMLLEIAQRFTKLLLSAEAIQIYRLAVGHAEQHPHIARLFYLAGPEHTIDTVADYLARQHQKKTLHVPNPRQAACQFLYMLKADAIMRAVLNVDDPPPPEEMDGYLKSCVALFIRGYGR